MGDEYAHRFHAGNVGDVWKHCVLTTVLASLKGASERRLWVIETHAGQGRYDLAATGEWTEGIGRLWSAPPTPIAAVGRYLALAPAPATKGPRTYPGSPLLTLSLLGRNDRALFCEIDPSAHAALTQHLGADTRAEIRCGDGLALLAELLAKVPKEDEALVVVDPAYGQKSEWQDVPLALVRAWQQRPLARLLLWYPVKSYTRPNAMLARLGKEEMPGTTMELITTPLELQRNRLNGSGVLLVNAPPTAIAEAAAAAPILGQACATHHGRWTTRSVAWGERWA